MNLLEHLKQNVNAIQNSEKLDFELNGEVLHYVVKEPTPGQVFGAGELEKIGKNTEATAYMIGACVQDESGAHIFDYQSEQDRNDFMEVCPFWLFNKINDAVMRISKNIISGDTAKN